MKGEKPSKVEQKGPDEYEEYEFHMGGSAVVPVNSTIANLYSSPVINQNTYNIIVPAGHESVDSILTYPKNDQQNTSVRIDKKDVEAIRGYTNPLEAPPEREVFEGTSVRVLKPKSGSYGQTTGAWSFTISGQKGSIKAKISDKTFLSRFALGTIRFHQEDQLKVKPHEKQIVEGSKVRMEFDIIEVLDYKPSKPSVVKRGS